MKLELELGDEDATPGSWLRGAVRVVEGGTSRSLTVALRFFERSPDYTAAVRELSTGDLATGELQAGQRVEFALQIPPDALPSVSSENAELYWELDAHSDERGRDSHARERIDVQMPST